MAPPSMRVGVSTPPGMPAALAAVTPESATAAYEDLVRLDDLTLVVVGDAEKLADPLRGAGFPDLEVRSG